MIDRFLNILFDDMEYVTKILYEPALLTDDIVYFNPKKLYYIRLEIVLQLIRKDINKFPRLALYNYLEDELLYFKFEKEKQRMNVKIRDYLDNIIRESEKK